MVMARFCARVRKRADLPAVSIKDVYQHPTVRDLATALAPRPVAPVADPVPTGLAEVLAEVLQVDTVDPDAHVFDDLGADSMVMARFCARVRKHPDLPAVSIKDVYQHPTLRGLADALAPAPTADPVLTGFTAVLAEVLAVEAVDPDAHVFDDLGADSMVMARFCARVRKHPDLPAVAIKDVYAHPTLRRLAAAVAEPVPVVAEPAPDAPETGVPDPTIRRASRAEYVLCGILQALFFAGYCMLVATIALLGYGWVAEAAGVVDTYLRSVVMGGATFVGLSILPILAKWALVGRWKPQQFPVWGPAYVRFWIVKTLVQRNPMLLLFTGTPLYPLYLRALGAKVGRDVAIFTKVPVCTEDR